MAGTPFENVRKGDWITVIQDKRPQPETFWGGSTSSQDYHGKPYLVIACSFPFIALTDAQERRTFSIDVRAWDIQLVSKDYARAFCTETRHQSIASIGVKKAGKRKQKPDATLCPRCGDRLIQRMAKDITGKNEWHFYCRGCEFDGGPVPQK